ncbi:hypothetical protein ACFSQD_10420 [Flavihumibacter stibioxidans]|uniref:hypothetical protein n=1 Tax=Flavihumibacter stibioxidans TaxID=1834163 RepID=UPI00164F529D|nr:hypothetical protein [Flavihumibacter stibioxidans]
MNKKFSILLLAAGISFVALPSCSGSGGGDPVPAEENLVITTSPAINGQQESVAPGPNFPLTVTVTSKMPPQGVKIEVSARPDGSGTTAFFTDTKTTSGATTSFTITNTPQLTVSRVTVTVTSVSKATNTKTGFYLYSRK